MSKLYAISKRQTEGYKQREVILTTTIVLRRDISHKTIFKGGGNLGSDYGLLQILLVSYGRCLIPQETHCNTSEYAIGWICLIHSFI